MKNRIVALLAALTLAVTLLLSGAVSATAAGYPLPADVTINAQSAILVSLAGNPASDMVLYEKDADEVRAPGAMMRYMVMAYALSRIEEKNLDIDTETGTYSIALFNQYVAANNV